MTDTTRTYTRAELRAGERPRVRKGVTYTVLAPRWPSYGDHPDAYYCVPSPCCGIVTRVPQYALDRPEGPGSFECGKPYFHRRGRGTGCRAWYRIAVPAGQDPHRPNSFDLAWTGQ